jgi:hypothetical protein
LARDAGALRTSVLGSATFTTSGEAATFTPGLFRTAVFLGAGPAAGLALALGFATFFAAGIGAAATVVDVSSVMSDWERGCLTPSIHSTNARKWV